LHGDSKTHIASRQRDSGAVQECERREQWASSEGRAHVKQRSAEVRSKGSKTRGASLVAKLSEKGSVQIAVGLPGADLKRARKIADRKGIGYKAQLNMLVHEGLAREARRQ
jgi:hypothetical protein